MKLHTRPGHYRVDTTQRLTMEGPYHPRRLRSLRSLRSLRITLVVMVCAVVALPFVVTAIVLLVR